MTNQDWLKSVRDNWSIIIAIVVVIMAWTSLNNRVAANEKEVISIRSLVERVIILEEDESHIQEHLAEIKQELKEIKVLVR